jgi:hypothetical protein
MSNSCFDFSLPILMLTLAVLILHFFDPEFRFKASISSATTKPRPTESFDVGKSHDSAGEGG